MLNCCIIQKIARNSSYQTPSTKEESDSEEFFDCNEDSFTELTAPDGRLHVYNDLKLIGKNEPLYVPNTQEPTPMTEDMVQEHTKILSDLGTTHEGAALRAKMQSAALLSDMEAFKAANPGSLLEDFVRWHSPRDYVEDDSNSGSLSGRMQLPGNIWAETWQNAKPISARKQKRIFDYTKEAEKVFHYFSSFSLSDLVNHIMPILIHEATIRISEARTKLELPENLNNFHEITKHCSSNNFDLSVQFIKKAETEVLTLQTIYKKFEIAHELEYGLQIPFEWNTLKNFVLNSDQNPEIKLEGAANGYFGKLLKRIFFEVTQAINENILVVREKNQPLLPVLPESSAREFILRVSVARPSMFSKVLPQRMYVTLSKEEFRLCGAFAQDTLFF